MILFASQRPCRKLPPRPFNGFTTALSWGPPFILRGVRGPSEHWKWGPLSAYNRLSAGGSPPLYSIQSHNAAEPGGGNRTGFVCRLVWNKKRKRKLLPTRPVSLPFTHLLFLCQPLVFFEQMQKHLSRQIIHTHKMKH